MPRIAGSSKGFARSHSSGRLRLRERARAATKAASPFLPSRGEAQAHRSVRPVEHRACDGKLGHHVPFEAPSVEISSDSLSASRCATARVWPRKSGTKTASEVASADARATTGEGLVSRRHFGGGTGRGGRDRRLRRQIGGRARGAPRLGGLAGMGRLGSTRRAEGGRRARRAAVTAGAPRAARDEGRRRGRRDRLGLGDDATARELGGGDAGEEGRGDHAARMQIAVRLVDGDDDRELGIVGRHDADEPGDVAVALRIASASRGRASGRSPSCLRRRRPRARRGGRCQSG